MPDATLPAGAVAPSTALWDRRSVPPEVAAGAIVLPEGGFRLRAYPDSAGYWTIGAGSRTMPGGAPVRAGDTITLAAAQALYARQAASYAPVLARLVPQPLRTGQASALCSMIHNLGNAALDGSVIQKAIAAGDMEAAVGQFGGWCVATNPATRRKEPSLGLMHRRHMDELVWRGAAPQAAFDTAYGPHALTLAQGLARYQAATAAAQAWGYVPVATGAPPAPTQGSARSAPTPGKISTSPASLPAGAGAHPSPARSDADALMDAELSRLGLTHSPT